MYSFGTRSKKQLEKVHPQLADTLEAAICESPYDFGITEGVRSPDRQLELYECGKSKLKVSKHQIQDTGYGHAVDIVVYKNGKVSWEVEHYLEVLEHIKYKDCRGTLRYGAFWDTADYGCTMKDQYQDYLEKCKRECRKPFVDACHIEITPG